MRARSFLRDQSGGPAAEFALVLPIALLFLFGIIDVGRFMWEYNRAEKATQMGARFAAVTDMVPSGLAGYSFARQCGIVQGDPVPVSAFPGMNCAGGGSIASPTASCTLSGASSCSLPTSASGAALGAIAARMQAFKSDITPSNVTVAYAYSGLGFSGDPNGSNVAPLVTVRLTGLTFTPISTQVFNINTPMPDFSYSLTMEDGAGTASN